MTSRDFYSDDMQDECARAALALTALFDAEASETETRLAESHLESCARCAWLLQSWTQSRYLLRRLPVPEVPPGLLMRVLLAMRLLSFSKRGAAGSALPATNFEPQTIEARDARLLAETILLSGANPFAPRRPRKTKLCMEPRDLPPLDASLPQPPAELHALILNRTVGSTPSLAVMPVEELEITRKVLHKPFWLMPKSVSASLLPVAAAWLLLLARVPQWAETVNPTTAQAGVSALTSPERPATRVTPQPVSHGAVREIKRELASSASEIGAPEPLAALNATHFVSASQRRDNAPAMATSQSEETSTALPLSGLQPPKSEPIPVASSPVKPQPQIAKAPHFTPAVSVTPIAWGSRSAVWNAPDVPTAETRAAQWHGAARHAMPPTALSEERDGADSASDDAPDAAEILDHVARLTDSRPDDVRDVMDDFRSSLMASTDESPTPADTEVG